MAPVLTATSRSGSLWLLVLLGAVIANDAFKCGRPLTTECLGATDIRYDPEASNKAIDQAKIWTKRVGLYRGEGTVRLNVLDPVFGAVPATPNSSVLAVQFVIYLNITQVGSRGYFHNIAIVPNAREVDGRIGFSTTRHEKDGTVLTLPQVATSTNTTSNVIRVSDQPSLSFPVNDDTVYISSPLFNQTLRGLNSVTQVCLDSACNQLQESLDTFIELEPNGTVIRNFALEVGYVRINSSNEWLSLLQTDFNAFNIPATDRPTSLLISDPCATGICPSEEEWCMYDPECSESPYQEPRASLKPGVIAGFVIAGFVLTVALLYAAHLYLKAKQEQRLRAIFAKRIAETIQVRGSMRSLSPEALAEEFRRIYNDVADGKLSEEELWEFISSGKAGEMEKHDFDALFAVMDVDKSGTVDFLEFCAFMGKCDEEYRAARIDRGSVVVRSVQRLEAADVTARRLSAATTAAAAKDTEVVDEPQGSDEK